MRYQEVISRQALEIQTLKAQTERMAKSFNQEVEKYTVWNKADQKRIKELLSENKKLSEEVNKLKVLSAISQ